MIIISWNVNGIQARLEAVNRLVAELQPDLMCFQKVRKKEAFITDIPGYFGWLGIMDDGFEKFPYHDSFALSVSGVS